MYKIIGKIEKHTYEDNYENGMVGEVSIIELDTYDDFESVKDAVKWFEKTYKQENSIEQIENNVIACAEPMQMLTDEGFRCATNDEIEEWKIGKINLWNSEYQMILTKVCPVENEEIFKALK